MCRTAAQSNLLGLLTPLGCFSLTAVYQYTHSWTMASNGLSRRRVPAASTSSTTADFDDDDTPSTPTTTTSPNPGAALGAGHAGSAFAGGSKIAFDPRDLDHENEEVKAGGKAPKLTLMEEVLLLGIKDKQVSTQPLRKRGVYPERALACHLCSPVPSLGILIILERQHIIRPSWRNSY